MKKISSIIMILVLIALIFTFAACGGDKMEDDVKNEMTTLKDGATSMMDDMSSAIGDMADDLTQGGNVTKDNSSTGLFDGMTSDKNTTENKATTNSKTTNAAEKTTVKTTE